MIYDGSISRMPSGVVPAHVWNARKKELALL